MSTRFVRKFASTTATGAFPDRSTDAGIGYDKSDGKFKYNDAGTIRSLVTEDKAQAPLLGSGSKVNLGGDVAAPAFLEGSITDVSQTASGTVQNTEYTLNSVVIKANSFNRNGQCIQVEAWLQLAANANAKNIKIYFGGTAIATVTGSTASGKDVYLSLSVIRLGASSQSAVGFIQVDTGTNGTMAINAAVAETDTADIIIATKTANTAAAAASGTGRGMIASFGN